MAWTTDIYLLTVLEARSPRSVTSRFAFWALPLRPCLTSITSLKTLSQKAVTWEARALAYEWKVDTRSLTRSSAKTYSSRECYPAPASQNLISSLFLSQLHVHLLQCVWMYTFNYTCKHIYVDFIVFIHLESVFITPLHGSQSRRGEGFV